MKTYHLQKTALFLLLAVLVSGCVERFEVPQKTERGKSIYDAWNVGISTTIRRYVEVAFAFNAWYEAPESQKISIEDRYLSHYKMRNIENDVWGLYYNGALAYKIYRNSKSLSETDATWVIEAQNYIVNDIFYTFSYDGDYYGKYRFDSFLNSQKTTISLQSIASNEWNVKITDEHVRFSTMDINIKSTDNTVPALWSLSSYTWNGTGCFAYRNMMHSESHYGSEVAFIDFEVTQDITYTPQNQFGNGMNYWTNGKVRLNAFDVVSKDNVEVHAEFSKLTNSLFSINITCQGVTEEWTEPKQYPIY